MKIPFGRFVKRTISDRHGDTKVIAIGIEFGLREEGYDYTVEEQPQEPPLSDER